MLTIKNMTSLENIPENVQEILPEIVNTYRNIYGENILEIRVMGSIPRGEAIPGVSDFDMLCILKEGKRIVRPASLKDAAEHFRQRLGDVSQVELTVVNEEYLHRNFDYRLIVLTDSVCLEGPNKYWSSAVTIPGYKLAKVWNPSSMGLLEQYKQMLVSDSEPELDIWSISKLIGKDVLKSFRAILMREFDLYSRSITQTAEDLIKAYPNHRKLFAALLNLYLNPLPDKKKVLKRVEQIEEMCGNFLSEVDPGEVA